MKNKFIIAGALVALIIMATLGTVLAIDDSGLETNDAATTDTLEDENARYLITEEQLAEIREASEDMVISQMVENLESFNLTDAQIMEIEELLLAIDELRDDIHASIEEFRDSNLTFCEIREEMKPLHTEMQNLTTELRNLLDSYGITMFEHRHMGPWHGRPGFGPRPGGPGMGGGHGRPGMGPRMGGPGFGNADGMPPNGPGFGGPRP